jgi:hypothetical protein
MTKLSQEQLALQQRARELAQTVFKPTAAATDQSEQYPWDNVRQLRENGFMGMTIPREYGGRGLSYLDTVLVVEEMAKACATMGRITVEANMGAIGAIMQYGTHEQKALAAECVLAGDKPAICISEPQAGSAASEMGTCAVRQGDDYLINGEKYWITGGGVSRLHLIFARVFDDGADLGIGAFIHVRESDAADDGLEIAKRSYAMGVRGIPETYIAFRDLKVHKSMLVVPPEGLKRGFAGLMQAYNAQRVGAGTVALGIAQGAFEEAAPAVRPADSGVPGLAVDDCRHGHPVECGAAHAACGRKQRHGADLWLSGPVVGRAGQDLRGRNGAARDQRRLAAAWIVRLWTRPADGTPCTRCAHVHHRGRHRADPAHPGRFRRAWDEAAADAGWVYPREVMLDDEFRCA